MGLLEQLQKEWPVIQQAPLSFAVSGAAVVLATWTFASWLHRNQIGDLKERIGLKDDTIADYKRKLDGASPDEAKGRLDALEKMVGHLRPRELSNRQAEIIKHHMTGFPGKTVGIGYANADPVCQAYAEALKLFFLDSVWAIQMSSIVSSWGPGFPGLGLIVRPNDGSAEVAAITTALNEAGIPFVRTENPVDDKLAFRLVVGPLSA